MYIIPIDLDPLQSYRVTCEQSQYLENHLTYRTEIVYEYNLPQSVSYTLVKKSSVSHSGEDNRWIVTLGENLLSPPEGEIDDFKQYTWNTFWKS